jgi:hypothetical protein
MSELTYIKYLKYKGKYMQLKDLMYGGAHTYYRFIQAVIKNDTVLLNKWFDRLTAFKNLKVIAENYLIDESINIDNMTDVIAKKLLETPEVIKDDIDIDNMSEDKFTPEIKQLIKFYYKKYKSI